MNIRYPSLATAALGLVGLLALSPAARAEDPPAPPAGVEVQARGPVHEAFAQPVDPQPAAGPVAPKPPPELIDELPPDQKPDDVEEVQYLATPPPTVEQGPSTQAAPPAPPKPPGKL